MERPTEAIEKAGRIAALTGINETGKLALYIHHLESQLAKGQEQFTKRKTLIRKLIKQRSDLRAKLAKRDKQLEKMAVGVEIEGG